MKPSEHLMSASQYVAGENMATAPALYIHGTTENSVELSVLVAAPSKQPKPVVRAGERDVSARLAMAQGGWSVWLYAFSLGKGPAASYEVDGVEYEVNTDFSGDFRIAFVSCNGQERGDLERSADERNRLWRRLLTQHAERPFQLLLHGGDQIYADELLDAHPLFREWADGTVYAQPDGLSEAIQILREAFLGTYLHNLQQPESASLQSRIPSLAMWDDHDICDGWGSLPEGKLDAAVGQALFATAREFFLVFQLGVMPAGRTDLSLDGTGVSLTWRLRLPGLDVIAPDLRSERRPDRVLGPKGWGAVTRAFSSLGAGHVFVLSTVPALGPRLSILEAIIGWGSPLHKFEDDLRDQWQSKWHREEWRRFMSLLAEVHERTPVTLLSGEIHLAARSTFNLSSGAMHQLIASGIAHPAPSRLYATLLEVVSWLPLDVLHGGTISMRPLPGRRARYVAQRNYLVLERRNGRWSAHWEFERSGPTPLLDLSSRDIRER